MAYGSPQAAAQAPAAQAAPPAPIAPAAPPQAAGAESSAQQLSAHHAQQSRVDVALLAGEDLASLNPLLQAVQMSLLRHKRQFEQLQELPIDVTE